MPGGGGPEAALLRRARAEHVREVLEANVTGRPREGQCFACLSLKGRHAPGRGSDNVGVRRALTRRAHEKDR